MKKLLFIIIYLAVSLTASSQVFKIVGTTDNLPEGSAVFLESADGSPIDCATIRGGIFQFEGKAAPTSYFYLKHYIENGNGRQMAGVILLEAGDINVNIRDGRIFVKGTPVNDACTMYFHRLDSLYLARKMPMIGMDSKEKSQEERDSLQAEFSRISREIYQLTYDTAKKNLTNGLGLYIMGLYADMMSSAQWDELSAIAPAFYQDDASVMRSRRIRNAARNTDIGRHYADFEMTTVDGGKAKLSDYVQRNKLTMIDVWVGWVCEERQPEIDILKETYKKYHDKGLEIVGVSIDTDADKWRKAIADFDLHWPQLCDFAGSGGQIVTKYGLNSFPYTYLIDQTGTVIAKGFRYNDIPTTIEKALDDTYTIIGNGFKDKSTISLTSAKDGSTVATAVVRKGKFELKGKADHTTFYYLTCREKGEDGRGGKRTVVFLEPGQTEVSITEDSLLRAQGTHTNDTYSAFYKKNHAIDQKKVCLRRMMDSMKREQQSLLARDYMAAQQAMDNLIDSTAKENVGNLIGMYLMATYADRITPELWDEMLTLAPDYYRSHKRIAEYAEQREAVHNTSKGKPFVDFEMKTPEGKSVRLSDYVKKNKLTMLDFWASWCGPCCAEIPAMKKALEQYHDKGFDIVGVSLDSKAYDWKKAIEKHGISWPQMSDLKGFGCEGAKRYGVKAIPATYLIDQNGTIIATNLRGENIAKMVGELLD